jgi:hypothetical protein
VLVINCDNPAIKQNNVFVFHQFLGPGVHSASNRNEYQRQKNNNVSGK